MANFSKSRKNWTENSKQKFQGTWQIIISVPIARRSCNIALNNNKTINAKRNHFPVVSASVITIHKSQGATFDEIIYEYGKKHSQQLVYFALSRVTRIKGLYIVTERNNPTFYHGQRESTSAIDLQN